MKRSRFTERQIACALQQAEAGTPVLKVCRKMGVTEQTFYRWKKKFGGLMPSEVRKQRQLEEENSRLASSGSRPEFGHRDAPGGDSKKNMIPARGRELVEFLRTAYRVSIRRACRVLPVSRSSYHYRSRRCDQVVLRKRIREITQNRVRYGYRRIHVLLRREGWWETDSP